MAKLYYSEKKASDRKTQFVSNRSLKRALVYSCILNGILLAALIGALLHG